MVLVIISVSVAPTFATTIENVTQQVIDDKLVNII